MKFGVRLILASFAAIGAGVMFVSMSLKEPLGGMAPTPIWKGILVIMLGIALFGLGVKYILDHKRDAESA